MRSKIVPEPKGPDRKTLSAKTIETIRLHGRKAAGALPVPGEADYYAKIPMPQADQSAHSRPNQNGRPRKGSQRARRFSQSRCRELTAKKTRSNVLTQETHTQVVTLCVLDASDLAAFSLLTVPAAP